MRINLPHLGMRDVVLLRDGHFLWMDAFGWHDCSPSEDVICQESFSTEN